MRQEGSARKPRGGGSGGGTAFSTGQAARYCYVTADTILNWINNGSLGAQRTVGGQHRIRLPDLLAFMKEHGMSTDLLASELDVRPFCWEFHCRGQADPRCIECLVHRSGALNCFELKGVLPAGGRLNARCDDCDYRRLYPGGEDKED